MSFYYVLKESFLYQKSSQILIVCTRFPIPTNYCICLFNGLQQRGKENYSQVSIEGEKHTVT